MSDCTRKAMLMLPLSEALSASTYAAVAHQSCPLPPYFGSMRMPNIPSSPALLNSSRGKMPSSSHSAAYGAISSLQKRVTVCRIISCSSVKYGNSVACCCGTVCVLIGILRLKFYQLLSRRHNIARFDQNGPHHAIHGGLNSLLHFHGFQRN